MIGLGMGYNTQVSSCHPSEFANAVAIANIIQHAMDKGNTKKTQRKYKDKLRGPSPKTTS